MLVWGLAGRFVRAAVCPAWAVWGAAAPWRLNRRSSPGGDTVSFLPGGKGWDFVCLGLAESLCAGARLLRLGRVAWETFFP